jgi:hypothetical protein
MKSNQAKRWLHTLLCGTMLATAVIATGCQVTSSGQTLPSPYYIRDDVQYFPPGPEFKLTEEANLMKAYNAERALEQR